MQFYILNLGGMGLSALILLHSTIPASIVTLSSSPLSNIIPESARFAIFFAKCAKNVIKYAVSKKNLGTTYYHTSLTFSGTIYTSELYQTYFKI